MQDRREPEDNEGDEAHLHGIRPEQRGGIGRTDELDEEDAKAEGAERGRGDMPAPREPAAQETARIREGAAHPDVGPPRRRPDGPKPTPHMPSPRGPRWTRRERGSPRPEAPRPRRRRRLGGRSRPRPLRRRPPS